MYKQLFDDVIDEMKHCVEIRYHDMGFYTGFSPNLVKAHSGNDFALLDESHYHHERILCVTNVSIVDKNGNSIPYHKFDPNVTNTIHSRYNWKSYKSPNKLSDYKIKFRKIITIPLSGTLGSFTDDISIQHYAPNSFCNQGCNLMMNYQECLEFQKIRDLKNASGRKQYLEETREREIKEEGEKQIKFKCDYTIACANEKKYVEYIKIQQAVC